MKNRKVTRYCPLKLKLHILLAVALAGLVSCNNSKAYEEQPQQASFFEGMHIADLTHTLDSLFPYIPTAVTYPFKLHPIATIEGFGVAANEWRIHEHIGTQFDAPNHFIKNGMSSDEVVVETLFVPAVVIDISKKAVQDPNITLTVEDITEWEKEYGKIPANSCVFMYSGWEGKLHSPDFIGLDKQEQKHFPGISKEAALFLVEKREISGVGVDVISIDPGVDHTYQTHRVILSKKKWALECVKNLKTIPPAGAYVFVGAPKVKGATGGLSRVIAIWK
jgi:kynurenine formamidase